MSKWTSRKFLGAVAAVVTEILLITGKLAPEAADTTTTTIVGAAALVLTIIGYQVAESAVDKARAANGK